MDMISRKLRSIAGNGDDKGIVHWCPGCAAPHAIWTVHAGNQIWTWNGDVERPTCTPSVRCQTNYDKNGRLPDGKMRTLCHYALTDGKIVFCSDSPHNLSGQTVDLPDWPY